MNISLVSDEMNEVSNEVRKQDTTPFVSKTEITIDSVDPVLTL